MVYGFVVNPGKYASCMIIRERVKISFPAQKRQKPTIGRKISAKPLLFIARCLFAGLAKV